MDLKVHINNIHGSQMAAKITGKFTIDNNDFRFTAIAFGRIGGQNIGAKLSKTTETELKKLGYDIDDVIMTLQKNLIQGDLTLPEGLKKESFVDD
jgi:cell fate regulator YaaT (PSP1 superfamily)